MPDQQLSDLPRTTPSIDSSFYITESGNSRETPLHRIAAVIGGALSVASSTVAAQPASPAAGDSYILPTGRTGADWQNFPIGTVAYFWNNTWTAIPPREGWLAYSRDTDTIEAYNGASWAPFTRLSLGTQGVARGVLLLAGPANDAAGGAFGGAIRLFNTTTGTGALDLLVGSWGPSLGQCQVGVFRSNVSNQQTALDICPNGAAGDAWVDICSNDVVADIANYEALEVRKWRPSGSTLPGFGSISTKQAGTGILRGLVLQRFGGGVAIVDGVATPDPSLNTLAVQTTAAVGGITISGSQHPALTFRNADGSLISYIGFPTATGNFFASDAQAGDFIIRTPTTAGFKVANNSAQTIFSANTTAVRVNIATNFLVGPSATAAVTINNFATPSSPYQQILASGQEASMLLGRWGAGNNGPRIAFAKSRGATPGTFGVLATNDTIGEFAFYPDNGSAYNVSALISAQAVGAPVSGNTPSRIYIGTTNNAGTISARWSVEPDGQLIPWIDNAVTLGSAANRCTQVWAVTGTIQTSDAAEKTPIQPIYDALHRAAARIRKNIGLYQWLDAVAEKGAGGARLHIGVTAQAVEAAFKAEGLDPARYGLFCADPLFRRTEVTPARIDDTGEWVAPTYADLPVLDGDGMQVIRRGVRYDQLSMLLAATAGGLHE